MKKPIDNTFLKCIAIPLLALNTSITLAGTATIESEGELSQLEYSGQQYLRMGTDRDGYMLHREGQLYIVSGDQGNETVIDASAAMQMFGSMMPEMGPSASGVHSLRNTGRKETIAGINGEVWIVDYSDEDGRHQVEMVLSKEAAVREMRDALTGFARSVIHTTGANPDQANEVFNALQKRGYGYLRIGNEMKVVALSGEKVDKRRFVLPAEPMQMPNLSNFGAAISAGAETESGGANTRDNTGVSFGEIFQKKAARQQQRAEEDVDKQTDDVVDQALDKALNTLFGN